MYKSNDRDVFEIRIGRKGRVMYFAIDRGLKLDEAATEAYCNAIEKGILNKDAPDDHYTGPSGVKFDRGIWKVKVSKQNKRIWGNKRYLNSRKMFSVNNFHLRLF